jgi:hypothetical protein
MTKETFTQMTLVIPKAKSGDFEIKRYKITKQDISVANIRTINHPYEVPPKKGTVTILARISEQSFGDDVIMSDSEFDKHTNSNILRIAHGNILIAGLGIGMILIPLLKKKDVQTITVIEKEQDVINLVYKHIKKYDKKNKLEVIHDDIFSIELSKERKFDVMYFDIWNNVCGDNYSQMKTLKKKFSKNRAKHCTIVSWEEERTKDLDRD